jgi:mannose-6-phosphate isomerase-like protein (cupin superfamily)
MALKRLAVNRRCQSSGLVIVGLLVAVSGCTTADSQQEGEASAVAVGDSAPPTVVMQPEDGDHLWVFAETRDELGPGGAFQIYVDPVRYPEALASFAKFGLGVGGALPVHSHDKTEEIAYFLSGQGAVTVYEDGTPEDVAVRAGSVVYTPPGSWHAIKNTGEGPLILVFAAIPNEKTGLLSFFRRIGAKPGEAATELTPEEFAKIAAEHDLILRPPDTEQ